VNKDFKVVICGTGKHKQDLVKLAKNLNVSSDIIFMDPVPADMYPSLLASCDIFVLASLSESWGISVAEALAMEKPVVASRIKGVTDIIHNEKTGLLFEPGNVQSLANAIIQLLSDDKLGKRLGKEGRRFVLSNFDWSLLTDRFIDLYEGLLADQRL
jgi:glycosyltransferase involved in cell wall biosynthesis